MAVMLSIFVVQVSAAVDPAVVTKSAASLVKLEIMKGDEKGNLNLQNKVKRCEYVTLILRMLARENDTDTGNIEIKFKDITKKHWAYNYIKLALKYGLIAGYTDNTVHPDDTVTYAQAAVILIRALGYEGTMTGSWPENVMNKAHELGLDRNLDLPADKQLNRGEASIIINNALTVDFKN